MTTDERSARLGHAGRRVWGPSPIAIYYQVATLIDLLCLSIAGWLWQGLPQVRMYFTALEAQLVTIGIVLVTWQAFKRLAPARIGRLLEIAWPITDAVLVSISVGMGAALLTLVVIGWDAASVVLLWPVAAISVLVPYRLFASGCARIAVRHGGLGRRIAIVGATELAAELLARLADSKHTEPTQVFGIFDDRDATRRPPSLAGVPVQGNIEALCDIAAKDRVDLIVIALPFSRAIDILETLQRVRDLAGEVVVLLDDSRQTPRVFSRMAVAGLPVLQLVRTPLMPGAVVVKRVLDICLGLLALLLTWPILLGAALAIRIEGPGPVFFRQQRLGLHGRMFEILKLRSMRVDPADDGSQGVQSDDPRITRVGRFLRATCIDELPQIFNVLRGDMSMVGPRPHVANMMVAGVPIQDVTPGYAARHRMKPGVTGWAQVNSLSGTITSAEMARAVTEHDLAYISEWSVWFDLRILARTLAISVFGRQAFEARSHEWRGI